MPSYERFRKALTRIDGAQWRVFERLATVFLTDEYPSLRPMAAASGDGGMDTTLFQPTDDSGVALAGLRTERLGEQDHAGVRALQQDGPRNGHADLRDQPRGRPKGHRSAKDGPLTIRLSSIYVT